MNFDSVSELMNYMKVEVAEVMDDTVLKDVRKTMVEAIKDSVYDKYDPTSYQRRKGEGGLIDENNIKIESIKAYNNIISVTIKNIARTNPNNSKNESDWGWNLVDRYIVNGNRYDWKKSKIYNQQPFPRDFYAVTVDLLRSGRVIEKGLKVGLKRKNIDIEFY